MLFFFKVGNHWIWCLKLDSTSQPGAIWRQASAQLVRPISEPEFTDLWQPDRPMPSLSIRAQAERLIRFEPEYHDCYLYVDKDIRKDWTHIYNQYTSCVEIEVMAMVCFHPSNHRFISRSVHGCRWLQQKGPLATGAPGLRWIHGGQHLSTSHCSEVWRSLWRSLSDS